MTKSNITVIRINDHEYWLEPGFLFISDRRYCFKWLADGGMVIWQWNSDCDAADELRFLSHNSYVITQINAELFERGVLYEKDKTQET